MGYELDVLGSIPGRSKKRFLLHSVKAVFGANPTPYLSTEGCFSGGKAVQQE
jgi:hypothetical protein